jgi:hypothetical protein
MLDSKTPYQLAPNLELFLHWAAGTPSFAKEWQLRFQAAEQAAKQVEEHIADAASVVLGTIERLDDRTAQVLTDLYCLSGQLPALMDKFLVGPLELRVEERQFAVGRRGGAEQVAVTYHLKIERYRYETRQQPEESLETPFTLNSLS